MAELVYCKGFVKEGKNGARACKNLGRSVLANGYCLQHQYLAVAELIEVLNHAQDTLKDLQEQSSTNNGMRIKQAQQDIIRVQEELGQTRKVCDADLECSSHLRDLVVTLRQIPTTGAPDTMARLREAERQITTLSMGTSSIDAQAFRTSVDHEYGLRQRDSNEREMTKTQSELQLCSARARGQEETFQAQLQNLATELKTSEMNRRQAQDVVDSLQKRLERSVGESRQVSGVYTSTIRQLQEEANKFKELYNSMVGRELKVGQTIKNLTQKEQELAKAMEAMKLSYEQKLNDARNQFAEHIKTGGVVLSERESALSSEVERLKSDLEMAVNELKIAVDAGKQAISQAVSSNVPHARVAEELMMVNNRLRQKNEELAQLQSMHDRKTAEFADAEIRVAQRIDQASNKDRSEIQRLARELHSTEQKLSTVQQEIMNLQSSTYELKRQHQNEVSRIQNSLREAQQQLSTLRGQREAEKQQLSQHHLSLKNQSKAEEMERNYKFTQIKDALEQEYRTKAKVLQDKFETTRIQLDQERAQLHNAQRQMQENSRTVAEQKATLENYRQSYDEKMGQFVAQKDSLMINLAQAKQQAEQFGLVESDYKKRISILQQTMEVQRTRYEGTIKSLTDKLNAAVSARNQVAINLEKCGAAREGLVAQVNNLTDENRRLQDQSLQVKTRMDMTRAQYESHLGKIQVENDQLQSEARKTAQQLADASVAHEHVKRMRDEAQQLRTNLEENIQKAKGSQQALQRLLQDRELEKQTVNRLQAALKDCSSQKMQNEQVLNMTNQDIRELKRMNVVASTNVRNLSEQYQQAMESRDAKMTKEQLTAKVQEESLRRQLNDIQMRNKDQEMKLTKLSASRNSLLSSMADNEYQRQQQIDALIRAQKLAGDETARNTGRSNLMLQQ